MQAVAHAFFEVSETSNVTEVDREFLLPAYVCVRNISGVAMEITTFLYHGTMLSSGNELLAMNFRKISGM